MMMMLLLVVLVLTRVAGGVHLPGQRLSTGALVFAALVAIGQSARRPGEAAERTRARAERSSDIVVFGSRADLMDTRVPEGYVKSAFVSCVACPVCRLLKLVRVDFPYLSPALALLPLRPCYH
jgi:hypothetical protein